MINKPAKVVLLFVVFIFLSACAKIPATANPVSQPLEAQATATSVNHPVDTPSTEIQPTVPPPLTSTQGPLWVEIDSPADGAVVSVPEVELKGQAAIGTTLSINDDVQYIENDEHFTDKIALVAGANLIEIIGSDEQGNEVTLYLTVYYEP